MVSATRNKAIVRPASADKPAVPPRYLQVLAAPERYLVVDLEATCSDDGSLPASEAEIIEIGAVLVEAATFGVVDEFDSFVRPVRHPVLTPFCTRLTTITQPDVDAAPGFAPVAAALATWLAPHHRTPTDLLFCSWGGYDQRQLARDCAWHAVPDPIDAPHLDLKSALARQLRLGRRPGLARALELAGLVFEGTAHRGIDDARNIVRLLPGIAGADR